MTHTVALVGGRGYTGSELLGLIAAHPRLELAFASSVSQAGQPLQDSCLYWPDADTRFIALSQDEVSRFDTDAWILAVPNGAAASWADAIRESHPRSVVIDLSADHRFDDAWTYGLPERNRERIKRARQIANPGCYATGAQLGLLPVLDQLRGTPVVFGVSGYSGAGKTPSPKNDPQRLADNLIPYKLSGHVHEQEISHHLGHDVRFMPHVAGFFRGISLTIAARLKSPLDEHQLFDVYRKAYGSEPRVGVLKEISEVRQVAGTPDVLIGGLTVDERDPCRITLVSVLDNLAKGAATQALQNLNLALGIEENTGIDRKQCL